MKIQLLKRGKRPFGIYAILLFLALLVLSNGADVLRALAGLAPYTLPDMGALVILALNAAIVIFYAVLAVGLWQMRDWAWYAAMIASGLSMFFLIWQFRGGGYVPRRGRSCPLYHRR